MTHAGVRVARTAATLAVLAVAGAAAAMAAEGLSWSVVIPPAGEPGEPMVISGTIYKPDGVTPVAGAELEVYHTDASGLYGPQGNSAPRLKGRMRTGVDGRYEFRTIRPGHYPNARIPAHVHARLFAPGGQVKELDEYWFAGDEFVTPAMAAPHASEGRFSPVVELIRGSDGVWHGVRDIRLPARGGR